MAARGKLLKKGKQKTFGPYGGVGQPSGKRIIVLEGEFKYKIYQKGKVDDQIKVPPDDTHGKWWITITGKEERNRYVTRGLDISR